jgi:hypothetical protein
VALGFFVLWSHRAITVSKKIAQRHRDLEQALGAALDLATNCSAEGPCARSCVTQSK